MPEVNPRPRAGAIRRSVNSADQKGVGSGLATAAELMLGSTQIPPALDVARAAVKNEPHSRAVVPSRERKPVRGVVPRAAGLRDEGRFAPANTAVHCRSP